MHEGIETQVMLVKLAFSNFKSLQLQADSWAVGMENKSFASMVFNIDILLVVYIPLCE